MTTQAIPWGIGFGPYVRGTGLAIAATFVIGMQVGTGGAETLAYYSQRSRMGYSFAGVRMPVVKGVATVMRDTAGDLEHIKSTLRLSVSSLSRAFGVSRQAIYDWQAGKAVAPENAERLADLARAADALVEANIEPSAQLFRRVISSGKGLLDLVREGVSAEASARKLVDILRTEAWQRERLQARLAGRGPADFSDAGIPMLDEES
jgi:hypothetical protein